jgi:hypothetical protein
LAKNAPRWPRAWLAYLQALSDQEGLNEIQTIMGKSRRISLLNHWRDYSFIYHWGTLLSKKNIKLLELSQDDLTNHK